LLQIFKNRKFVLFVGVIFLLITWVMYVTSQDRKEESKVEFFLNSAITPLENVFSYSSKTVNDSWKTLVELGRLKVENQKLMTELSLLKTRQLSYANLEQENEHLRDALQFEKNQIDELISAEIIAVNPSNWSYTFIINKGLNYGIKKGLAVISPEGVVGRIGEVRNGSAEVILVSDPREGNYIGGTVKRTNNLVIVRGGGDNLGQCTINPAIDSYFFDLKKNDLIVTSDASEKFPSGVPLGKVIAVNKGSNKMTYQAFIKPIVNLGKLQFVYVVKMIKRLPGNIKYQTNYHPPVNPMAPAAETAVSTVAPTPDPLTEPVNSIPVPIATTGPGGQ
jgi:rod shape-determining protein MreC